MITSVLLFIHYDDDFSVMIDTRLVLLLGWSGGRVGIIRREDKRLVYFVVVIGAICLVSICHHPCVTHSITMAGACEMSTCLGCISLRLPSWSRWWWSYQGTVGNERRQSDQQPGRVYATHHQPERRQPPPSRSFSLVDMQKRPPSNGRWWLQSHLAIEITASISCHHQGRWQKGGRGLCMLSCRSSFTPSLTHTHTLLSRSPPPPPSSKGPWSSWWSSSSSRGHHGGHHHRLLSRWCWCDDDDEHDCDDDGGRCDVKKGMFKASSAVRRSLGLMVNRPLSTSVMPESWSVRKISYRRGWMGRVHTEDNRVSR